MGFTPNARLQRIQRHERDGGGTIRDWRWMPLCFFHIAAFDFRANEQRHGIVMRNALEWSHTTAAGLAAMGANSLEILPPALNSAMSMPLKELLVSSLTTTSWRET